VAALECEAVQRVPARDHVLVIASVLRVPYVAESAEPLIRFAGRYPGLR
jgi:flavin reductase (DIM6/NTAB) family NADH-FMN oxidoreductase RutF